RHRPAGRPHPQDPRLIDRPAADTRQDEMTQERRLADLERSFAGWERKKLLRTSALVAVPVLVALGYWGYGRVEVDAARESVVSLTQSLNAEQQAKAGLEAQLAKTGVRLAELQQSLDQVGTER